jgi:hypothetical protein
VPNPLEAADFNLASDVHLNLSAKVTLNFEAAIYDLSNPRNLVFRQVSYPGVTLKICLCYYLLRPGCANTEHATQSNLNALVIRNVYA